MFAATNVNALLSMHRIKQAVSKDFHTDIVMHSIISSYLGLEGLRVGGEESGIGGKGAGG